MMLWLRPRIPAVALAAGLAPAILIAGLILALALVAPGCRGRPATQPGGARRAATPKNTVLFTPEPYQPDRGSTGLFDVTFIDQRRGWAVGQTAPHWLVTGNGILVRTVNGGKDWHSYTTRVWPPLFGVSFADAKNGWIVGGQNSMGSDERPRIWHTGDGGATWQPQKAVDAVRLRDVCAVDARTAFAVDNPATDDDPGMVYATHDGGATWTPSVATDEGDYLRPGIERTVHLNRVSFSDSRNGWAVGALETHVTLGANAGTTQGVILHTSDGGAHWWQKQAAFELLSVSAADSRHIWAVGYQSSVLYSRDGGGHWTSRVRVRRAGRQFLGLRFWDAQHGWIVGSARRGRRLALYTKNGGLTWTQYVGAKGEHCAVSLAGRPDVAFCVGAPPRIDRIWAAK